MRDFIPEDKVGLFQGIRMIFVVLLPMIIGPAIGDLASISSNITIIEYGAEKLVPSTSMFLWAAVVAAFAFIPVIVLAKRKALKRQ